MTRIRELRERASLSQSDLARLVGVDKGTVQRWENDGRTPLRRHRKALAQQLGCGVDEITAQPQGDRTATTSRPPNGRKPAAPPTQRSYRDLRI